MSKTQIQSGSIFATDAETFERELAEQAIHGGRTAAIGIAERPVAPKGHRFASLVMKDEPKAGKRTQIDLSLLSEQGMVAITALEASLIAEAGDPCYFVSIEAPANFNPALMNEADVRRAIEAHLVANLAAEGIQNASTSLMPDTKVGQNTGWVGFYYPQRSVGSRISSLTPLTFTSGKKTAQSRTFVRQLQYANAFHGLVLMNGNTMYFVPARNVIEAIKKSSGQIEIELASYARPIAILPKPVAFLGKVEFTVLPNGNWTIQVVATTSETGRLDTEEKQAYCLNLSYVAKGGAAVQTWTKSLDKNDKVQIGRVAGIKGKPVTAAFTLGANGDVNYSFSDEDGQNV